MSDSVKDLVNETMATFVKGSICELVALLCGQARKFIRLLEKFPLEKRQLAKEEIEKNARWIGRNGHWNPAIIFRRNRVKMSRPNNSRQIEDSKRRITESVMMIHGLVSLLDNHRKILSEQNQPDPSNGKIASAKQAVKNMAEKLREVLELEELQINENIVTQ